MKFNLHVDVIDESLIAVCTDDKNKKHEPIKKLAFEFNLGKIEDIKNLNLPIPTDWDREFIRDFTFSVDGMDFGMISERDLQNRLKRDPELHNKVHFLQM